MIYGLNHGDTDEAGEALGYESNTTWLSTENWKMHSSMHSILKTLTKTKFGPFGKHSLTAAMVC